MALQEDQVREALKQVIDPELFVNIVDLGLIYVVDVLPIEGETEKYNVKIDMTMTSPMCPAGPQLVAETKKYAVMPLGFSLRSRLAKSLRKRTTETFPFTANQKRASRFWLKALQRPPK